MFFRFQNLAPSTIVSFVLAIVIGSIAQQARPANGQTQLPSSRTRVPVKTIATKLTGFGVPFKLDKDDDSFIEVQLYVSSDKGKSWQFHGRSANDMEEFPFKAKSDGEYWFALRTLNRDRKLIPEGKITPELKIMVDTVKPKLDFRIETDPAGRVVCRWRAEDPNIDPRTLRILYREDRRQFGDDDPDIGWTRVPIQLKPDIRAGIYADQLAWWPDTHARNLIVRLMMADAAGNDVWEDRSVLVPQVAWRNKTKSSVNLATSRPASTANPANRNRIQNQMMTEQQVAGGGSRGIRNPYALAGATNSAEQKPASSYSASSTNAGVSANQPAAKPGNVVCEGGVCRIIPPAEDSVAAGTIGNGLLGNRSVGSGSPGNQANAVRRPPRTANVPGFGNHRRAPVQLVGSRAEFVDPPPPVDDFAPLPQMARGNPARPQMGADPAWTHRGHNAFKNRSPSSGAGQGGVTWQSQPESGGIRQHSTSSTTLAPDPSILPEVLNPVPIAPGGRPYPATSTPGELIEKELHANQQRPFSQLPTHRGGATESRLKIQGEQVIAEGTTRRMNTEPRPELVPAVQGFPAEVANQIHPNHVRPSANGPGNMGGSLNRAQESTNPRAIQSSYRPSGASARRAAPLQPRPNSLSMPFPTRAGMQAVNTPRFRLNYDVDAIDPSGVERVTLWMTRDGGENWDSWGNDPDHRSPFPVEVQQSGLYGFRIVIKSRDGLQGKPPMRGDDADMWIRVDLDRPLTKILSAPYGRGDEAGKLVINYQVADPFLELRPIRLSYARNPAGPWTTIEDGLRNEGRYLWKVGSQVPDRVFLRLEARDTAGNVGIHLLPQALDVSGLVPRGHINGVEPVMSGGY